MSNYQPAPQQPIYIQQRQGAGCVKIALVILAIMAGLAVAALVGFFFLFLLT
jgi:high-affinity Fe2+/Pb2+ permease